MWAQQQRTGTGGLGGTSLGGGITGGGQTGGGLGISGGGLGVSGGGLGVSGGGLGVSGGVLGATGGFSGSGLTSPGGITGRTGSFSGASATGFTGGSFSGATGFSGGFSGAGAAGSFGGGGSFRPAATGTTGRIGGATSVGVSTANPFVTYYATPLAYGLPGGTGTARFGQPLYGTLTAATPVIINATGGQTGLLGGATGLTGGLGTAGLGTAGLASSRLTGTGLAGSTTRTSRAPAYVVVPGFPVRPPAPSKLLADAREVLMRSSSLPSRANYRVEVDGGTVVLQGRVADERERQLAEALLMLTPGIRSVRNELEVQPASPPP
jgi:hypothetical protein